MKDLTDTRIFYINLQNRIDRRKHFESQAALLTMPHVQRIPAVQGSSVDVFNDRRLGANTRVQIITEYRRSHYEIHSRGAIGASMSHLLAWKTFLKTDAKYALILEDDVELPATFSMMVRDSAKDLPADWDIWILGWNHIPVDLENKTTHAFKQIMHFIGAHCYIITRNTAKILVENMFPIETHVEHYMSNMAFLKKLKIVRDTRLYIPQIDYHIMESDIRKADGCPACVVNDKKTAIEARVLNMNHNFKIKRLG